MTKMQENMQALASAAKAGSSIAAQDTESFKVAGMAAPRVGVPDPDLDTGIEPPASLRFEDTQSIPVDRGRKGGPMPEGIPYDTRDNMVITPGSREHFGGKARAQRRSKTLIG